MKRTLRRRVALVCTIIPVLLAGCGATSESPSPTIAGSENSKSGTEPSPPGAATPPPAGATPDGGAGWTPAPGSRVVVVWMPDDHEGIVHGGGIVNADGSVTVSIDSPPPAESLVQGSLGIGVIMTVRPGAAVPTGVVHLDALGASPFDGQATRYFYVHRASAGVISGADWPASFPTGTSCARCLPAVASEIHDKLEPASCDELARAAFAPVTEVCNWY